MSCGGGECGGVKKMRVQNNALKDFFCLFIRLLLQSQSEFSEFLDFRQILAVICFQS